MNNTVKILLSLAIVFVLGAAFYSHFTHADSVPAVDSSDAQGGPPVVINVPDALSERILGNPKAPIRIAEHSSFTCPHCAHFHKETFGKIKAQWIDTGKAYLVFSDFPLNAPALHASMTARCLPHDKYFDFVRLLYEKQEDWAFGKDYLERLQKMAEGYGLDARTFKGCIASKELQEGIVKRMTTVQALWKVNSTPSFVINNKTVISGAIPFEDFSKKIEEAAAKGVKAD